MAVVTKSGFRSIYGGIVDTDGFVVGGLEAAEAGEVGALQRLFGALSLPIQIADAEQLIIGGDDGVIASEAYEPESLPSGELQLSVVTPEFEAIVQGTLVEALGTEIEVATLQPLGIDFQDMAFVAHARAKTVPGGARRWITYFVPLSTVLPKGSELATRAFNPFTYSLSLSKSGKKPWGADFTNVLNGTLGGAILYAIAPNPIMITPFLGDGVEADYVLPFTPAADSADAVRVWHEGTALVFTTNFTVDTSTKTVTFVTPASVNGRGAVMYQFPASEL